MFVLLKKIKLHKMKVQTNTILYFLFLSSLFFFFFIINAQQIDTKQQNETVREPAEIELPPKFPGGITEFYKFIGKNFRVPEEASKNNSKGKIYIQFMIEKDGTLSEFKVLKGIGNGLDEEAIRVLKLSPKWIPGSLQGKPTRVQYSLPITIG